MVEKKKNSRSISKNKLLKIARDKGIKGRYGLTKKELLNVLMPVSKSFELEEGEERVDKRETREWRLPSGYGETKIVMLVVDPYCIYTYWEIDSHSLDEAKKALGSGYPTAQYILRLYDVTYIEFNGNNAHSYFDIYISVEAGNWYINLWSAEKSYCADIGLLSQEDRFYALARSNFIHTPRVSPSDNLDERWMRINGSVSNIELFSDESGNSPGGYEEDEPQINPEPTSQNKEIAPPISPLEKGEKRGYLKDEPLEEDKKEDTKAGEREDAIVSLSGEEVRGQNKITWTSSRDLQIGISSESISSPFTHTHTQGLFLFTLNTEIILYGVTQPHSQVSLLGRDIDVREDGTFSIRLALPDGVCTIPVIAKSPNGREKREIITTIVKDSK